MNSIKSTFSIKDLENLSGIKAHTIRIWEKRYNVFEPMRTDTNIRYYDTNALQKLLNITLLHDYGYKISKISTLSDEEIKEKVRGIISQKSAKHHAISAFKLAMMNFDQKLFFETYDELLSEKSFNEVFFEVFIPLMEELGELWQSDTITPAHEHFISYLIKLKLLINTEEVIKKPALHEDRIFVLFLPLNEIHELGLMYLNYELNYRGYHTVYLGESVPVDNLTDVKNYFSCITFVGYITVEPNIEEVNDYVKELEKATGNEQNELWLIGRMTENISKQNVNYTTKIFQSITDLLGQL
ncbi:MerR family transcriptional regulator [Flavobacterium sp.]|uniref:MerR family transcriptional regulator n=1 Tax=Flavobacterium sp. TaxID=239 RepID=UPI00262CA64A|nr:MerR family transcriptional regulator [Flavobacterium sp.]